MSWLTRINRVLRGQLIPKIPHRLCFPLKLAYTCYLKTIRKDKRPNAISAVKTGTTKSDTKNAKGECNTSTNDPELKEVKLHIIEVQSSVSVDMEPIVFSDETEIFVVDPNHNEVSHNKETLSHIEQKDFSEWKKHLFDIRFKREFV